MKETISVAIVDDHHLVREGMANLIGHMPGFKVVLQACNGADLLQKIDASNVELDMCLVDVNMPVMDGFETVKRLRKQYAHIKILVVTVFEADQAILRMYKTGAHGYITKSCTYELLQQALTEINEHGSYYPSEIIAKFPNFPKEQVHQYNKKLLTESEVQFLQLCCSELGYSEIANIMNLSPRTVEKYPERLARKIGVSRRIELALYAQRAGLINTKR